MTATAACPVLPSSPSSANGRALRSSSDVVDQEMAVGRLRVGGLWCTSCAHALERVFAQGPGVSSATVSFAASEAVVRFDPGVTDLASIAARAAKVGYTAVVADDDDTSADDVVADAINDLYIRLAAALVFGMWAMGGSWALIVMDDLAPSVALAVARLAVAAALPVVFFSGAPFLRAGFRTSRVGAPGMDALVSAGALLSLGLSLWHVWRGDAVVYVDTATMLVTLLLTGRLIEHHARRRGARALRSLLYGVPQSTRLERDGAVIDVLATAARRDDVVVVEPGDVCAVDGVVVEGVGEVTTAIVSGEAVPHPVAAGSLVLAGTRLLAGRVRLRVVGVVGERRLDGLAARSRELLIARTGLAGLAERAARVLVPTVLVLAALSAVAVFGSGAGFEEAVVRAVAVVVVTCPCALGLATPAALLQAVAVARRCGVVFRDVASLEGAATIGTIAFDKTGTLTTGRLRVASITHHGRIQADADVLALAAAVEGDVEHPVAEAVRVAAGNARRPDVSERRNTVGLGVSAVVDGHRVDVARARPGEDGSATGGDGDLAVAVRVDDVLMATLRFTDELRPEAVAAVARARSRGLRVVILSGDTQGRAAPLGRALQLPDDDVRGGLSPEDKLRAITVLQKGGSHRVAFVGDGDNDTAALAAADLGIAMQGSSTAALEAAPVVLQRPGLDAVTDAIDLARRTARVMRENLAFALVFNAVMVPAAMVGAVTPAWAAVAMGTSSVAVTLNALRVR